MDLDKALRRERVGLYAFTVQGLYATGVAAVALGIARAMLSELITCGHAGRPGTRESAARLGPARQSRWESRDNQDENAPLPG